MIPETGSLWRCSQCHRSIYRVANVEEHTVYYRIYDDEKRLLMMNLGLWLITHELIKESEINE